ncbi:MAG: hypothetical protein ABSD10_04020 [Candidatus Saccharimonadales bacterium]|jgi:hypothetical protein
MPKKALIGYVLIGLGIAFVFENKGGGFGLACAIWGLAFVVLSGSPRRQQEKP